MSIEFSKDQVLNALPAQEGKSGKFLSTDGTDALWKNAAASYANITEMFAGDNAVGEVYGAGGTSWRVDSISVPMSINNYTALSDVNITAFGALEDGSDAAPALQAAINYAAPARKKVKISGSYTFASTINILTDTNIDAEGSSITVTPSAGFTKLFDADATTVDIYRVSIIGGDWEEDSPSASGTITFFTALGDYNAGSPRYVWRFNFQRIRTYNFDKFIQGEYLRTGNVDNCFIFGRGGIVLESKCVEINITNSVIFGTNASDTATRGVAIGENVGVVGQYPEGIKIDNCTIDNFSRSLSVYEILDLSVSNNWIAVSTDSSQYCLFFGHGTSNFFQGANFTNNTYFKGKILFSDHSAPPTTAFVSMSNEIYLQAQRIRIGNFWHDITMDGWDIVQPTTPINDVGILCNLDNQRCSFRNIKFKGPWTSLIQFNGTLSQDSVIDNVWADQYVADPFFSQTPIMIKDSMAGLNAAGNTTNGGSMIWYDQLTAATAGNNLITTPSLSFKRGALVEVKVSGLFTNTLTGGQLSIIQNTNTPLSTFVGGAGWRDSLIDIGNTTQRVDATVIFKVVSNDPTTIDLQSLIGDTTCATNATMSIRYI